MSASLRDGVEWIALNDEPGIRDVNELSGLISVVMLADLFGKPPQEIARRVLSYRAKHGERS